MSDITINTDGTIQNTKLAVDGKDITKKEKVISMIGDVLIVIIHRITGNAHTCHISSCQMMPIGDNR